MENLSATDIMLLFIGMTVLVVIVLAGGVLMASRAGGPRSNRHRHLFHH